MKEEIKRFIQNYEELRHEHIQLFNNIQLGLNNLNNHKKFLVNEVIPLSRVYIKYPNQHVFKKLNKSSLKLQLLLTQSLSNIVKSSIKKEEILKKQLSLAKEFNDFLEKEHSALSELLIKEKNKKIYDNLLKQQFYTTLAIQKQKHLVELIQYNQKLLEKFNNYFDYKAELAEKEIELLKFYSSIENKASLKQIEPVIIALANKLDETIISEKPLIIEPISDLLEKKYRLFNELKIVVAKK